LGHKGDSDNLSYPFSRTVESESTKGMKPAASVAVKVTLFVAGALFFGVGQLSSQEGSGSTGAALGGAMLGAYSGTVLGLLGASGPCNRTLSGARCPRVAAALGGAVGLAAGVRMGRDDRDALTGRFRGAGYGAVVGGLVGYGLSLGVRQYEWLDVGTFAAVGAGIGASPAGAGLGFGAGAVVGALSCLVIPDFKIGDAVALSLVGLTLGGLAGWVMGTEADGGQGPAVVIPLQVRFP
jgi:hypothetical protein